jgi:dynactin-5
VVEASVIGSGVRIGKGCVVGKRCVIKDCVLIRDGTVLAPDTVVAPFSIFEGCPGRLVGELPESTPELHKSLAQALYYESFKQAPLAHAPHPVPAPVPPVPTLGR